MKTRIAAAAVAFGGVVTLVAFLAYERGRATGFEEGILIEKGTVVLGLAALESFRVGLFDRGIAELEAIVYNAALVIDDTTVGDREVIDAMVGWVRAYAMRNPVGDESPAATVRGLLLGTGSTGAVRPKREERRE